MLSVLAWSAKSELSLQFFCLHHVWLVYLEETEQIWKQQTDQTAWA